jgi:hypothetical protein
MKWFRDVILIPSIITITGGLGFMIWGAWYSGVKLHSPFSGTWFKAVLTAPVPVWIVLIGVAVTAAIFVLYRSALASLAEKQAANERAREEADIAQAQIMNIRRNHEAESTSLRRPEPRLEAVWEESYWGDDTVEGEPAIYLSGWAFLSMHNGPSACVIVQASVNGSEAVSIPPIHLGGRSELKQFFTNVTPPIGTREEPLQATIKLIDSRNRHYVLPERTFRWSDSPGDS